MQPSLKCFCLTAKIINSTCLSSDTRTGNCPGATLDGSKLSMASLSMLLHDSVQSDSMRKGSNLQIAYTPQ